mgnify:CR=1 FL=1|jgi:hypothetical protein
MFTVEEVKEAEINLEPLMCEHCCSTEVTYYQSIGDAYCANCGQWQEID